jgi:hypothetical protein
MSATNDLPALDQVEAKRCLRQVGVSPCMHARGARTQRADIDSRETTRCAQQCAARHGRACWYAYPSQFPLLLYIARVGGS